MSEARANGASSGGASSQQIYFQLSAVSAEDTRLRLQLDLLRTKERRILHRLEQLTAQMDRLRRQVDVIEKKAVDHSGKQPFDRGYGSVVWDVTELRY